MTRRIRLFLSTAALLTSMALCTASVRTAAAQTASSAAKKKKKTASSSSASAKSSSSKSASAKTVSTKSKGKSRGRVPAKPKGQAAPTSDRIREIQAALQKDGSYDGEPNGKWDAATTDAMRKYQDKNGINPSGKIDAISLNKMGLGSETAGKGAPVPAPTSRTAPSPTSSKPSSSSSPASE
ncbi:MAG TPA: peptidoglycan-binding domain-containing protein [Candidatus Acidoferrales bacterium]|nr:peptidoglycan-binding domain-containing protein [Candidatus Acidoferrales bacterium]